MLYLYGSEYALNTLLYHAYQTDRLSLKVSCFLDYLERKWFAFVSVNFWAFEPESSMSTVVWLALDITGFYLYRNLSEIPKFQSDILSSYLQASLHRSFLDWTRRSSTSISGIRPHHLWWENAVGRRIFELNLCWQIDSAAGREVPEFND
jgi:hypothetical protein